MVTKNGCVYIFGFFYSGGVKFADLTPDEGESLFYMIFLLIFMILLLTFMIFLLTFMNFQFYDFFYLLYDFSATYCVNYRHIRHSLKSRIDGRIVMLSESFAIVMEW